MTNDSAAGDPPLPSVLQEAIDALRATGREVVPYRDMLGLYRVDDRPDMTAGEVIALTWRLGLMSGSAKVQ